MRNGTRDGVQLFKCMACGRQFRGKAYLDKLTLWESYLNGKQTLNELAATHSVSTSTVQRLLRGVSIPWHNPVCRGHGVVQIDATYFGRNCGVLIAQAQHQQSQRHEPQEPGTLHQRVFLGIGQQSAIEKGGFSPPHCFASCAAALFLAWLLPSRAMLRFRLPGKDNTFFSMNNT